MKSQLLLPYTYNFLEDVDVKGFDDIYLYAEKRDVPSVSKGVGKLLTFFAGLYNPKSVLELGCGIGVAAKFILQRVNCKYTGVDNNHERIEVAKRFLAEYQNVSFFNERVENFLAKTEEKYDFIFVDSIKKDYEKVWYLLKPVLQERALIIFDDIFLYGYAFQEDSEIPLKYREGVRLVRRFIKNIQAELGSDVTFFPIENGIMVINYGC
ncbi:MAG: methyltransferase domain-containing protein [Calditerrivibrio sp.]|nr:methyltransferase domain-containing protein [Calditerrivibrio sp.]MCA1932384.1 methyltransferase domain-containing protein [Calditerrivibrio sp.]